MNCYYVLPYDDICWCECYNGCYAKSRLKLLTQGITTRNGTEIKTLKDEMMDLKRLREKKRIITIKVLFKRKDSKCCQ